MQPQFYALLNLMASIEVVGKCDEFGSRVTIYLLPYRRLPCNAAKNGSGRQCATRIILRTTSSVTSLHASHWRRRVYATIEMRKMPRSASGGISPPLFCCLLRKICFSNKLGTWIAVWRSKQLSSRAIEHAYETLVTNFGQVPGHSIRGEKVLFVQHLIQYCALPRIPFHVCLPNKAMVQRVQPQEFCVHHQRPTSQKPTGTDTTPKCEVRVVVRWATLVWI